MMLRSFAFSVMVARSRLFFVLMLFAFACILAALVWMPRAQAHASLIATDPPSETLASAPKHIVLTFNEPVSPLVLSLVGPGGGAMPLGAIHQRDNGLDVELPPFEGSGTYVLSWRVVSTDGHPVSGAFVFAIGAPSEALAVADTDNLPRSMAIWAARLTLYLGLFFGIGAAVFRAFLRPNCGGRRTRVLFFVGMAAVLASLALFGLDALDASFLDWYQPVVWETALFTRVGLSAIFAFLAFTCALASYVAQSRMSKAWALFALGLLGLSLAASGHASAAPPQWLSRPAVWVHGVALAFWLGSLLPLARVLYDLSPSGLAALQRFSRWIPYALAMLIGSGSILVYLQFDRAASLWETSYGQILAVKLALVAGLLGLGAFNRYYLTKGALQAEARTGHRMRRVILIEAAVAIVILSVVALWRFTPPPRALAAVADSSEIFVHAGSSAAMAQVIIKTNRAGKPGQLQLLLFDANMSRLHAREVTLWFSNKQAGIEPIRYEAAHEGAGTWRISALDLPDLPRWSLRIEALVSDFDRISLTTDIEFKH